MGLRKPIRSGEKEESIKNMDEDEKRLNELQKIMKQKDDPSFWELFQSIWHVNLLIAKKQRTINQLRWIVFQTKLEAFISGLFRKR